MATINDPTTPTSVAAVKAASVAPIATDPSLVVSLSPNSAAPAPTGNTAVNITQIAGSAVVAAAAGIIKIGLSGNTGAAVDAAAGAAAPANVVWTAAVLKPSDLLVTATAAVNTGFTTTLPAVVGQFHYITSIQIVRATNATATVAGAALTITTTNLPGNPVWTFGNASVAGGTSVLCELWPTTPLKSSVANTNTTIVVPAAGAGEILRVNVTYYTGA